MGCSASTQGGLYATPNDDDDTRWFSPTTNRNSSGSSTSFDVMMEDYKETYYSNTRSGSIKAAKEGTSNRHVSAKRRKSMGTTNQPPSSSCCHHNYEQPCCAPTQTETAAPCAAVGSSITSLCQNKLVDSPLRKPFPSNNDSCASTLNNVQNSMPHNLNSKGRAGETYLQPRKNDNNKQLNDSINSIIDTSSLHQPLIIDKQQEGEEEYDEFPTRTIEEETIPIFSNRQWLVLPEQKYDMNTLHLPSTTSCSASTNTYEMYLGSMYWTPASPVKTAKGEEDGVRQQGISLLSPSTNEEEEEEVEFTPTTRSSSKQYYTGFGIQDTPTTDTELPSPSSSSSQSTRFVTHKSNNKNEWEDECEGTSISSETATTTDDNEFPQQEEYEEEEELEESFLMFSSPKQTIDISRELLDYSQLEESYVLESKRSHQPPRRLFNDDEDVGMMDCDGDDIVGETSLLDLTGDDSMLDESFEIASPSRLYQHRRGLQNINEEPLVSSSSSSGSGSGSSNNNQKEKNGKSSKGSQKFSSILCSMRPTLSSQLDESIIETLPHNKNNNVQEENVVRVVTPPLTCPSSPGVSTFYGHWGSRRERHISTLPSTTPGQPIRLRVIDKSSHLRGHSSDLLHNIGHSMSSSSQTSPGNVDYYSYDPYFSCGKYTITLPNGKPYGNGLTMKMGLNGQQFMILQDVRGVVLAVIKSRYTYVPSMIVYAPKPRFVNQIASGHRLTRRVVGSNNTNDDDGGTTRTKKKKSETVVIVDGHGDNESGDDNGEALYPWALISKSGRTMGDVCTVHLVNDNVNKGCSSGRTSSSTKSTTSSGIFDSEPSFCGRHEFDRELHTHTVVSRKVTHSATTPTTSSSSKCTSSSLKNKSKESASSNKRSNNSKKNSTKPHSTTTSLEEEGGEEVPCCVIVRDSTNLDAVDLTIAPGIDPLLMICYLASHSKMDVEPLLSGY